MKVKFKQRCWLCSSTKGDDWRTPCRCIGFSEHAHASCLVNYIKGIQNGAKNIRVPCPYCEAQFNFEYIVRPITIVEKIAIEIYKLTILFTVLKHSVGIMWHLWAAGSLVMPYFDVMADSPLLDWRVSIISLAGLCTIPLLCFLALIMVNNVLKTWTKTQTFFMTLYICHWWYVLGILLYYLRDSLFSAIFVSIIIIMLLYGLFFDQLERFVQLTHMKYRNRLEIYNRNRKIDRLISNETVYGESEFSIEESAFESEETTITNDTEGYTNEREDLEWTTDDD